MSMTKTSSFFRSAAVCAATLLLGGKPAALAEGVKDGVEQFDPKKFPGYVVDEVVVPVPSEIFAVLDKLGEPNWRQELRKLANANTSDRTRLSLLFGVAVAEGFVAVQAQDRKSVEDIGKEVIDLAKALGLSKSVLPHAQSILDAADKNNWPAIRKEFDLTQKTVRDTMEQMKDSDLSQCVSVGGWLRGTAAVTSVVGKNFSDDRSELLNQPMLVNHFIAAIAKMSPSKRKHPMLSAISKGLEDVKQVMEAGAKGFTKEAVGRIGGTCNGLLSSINTK
ncbi:MAG: hypothetical protein K1X78_14970 [Verrucomicrobiaceae bacterium]|nr:hypothetical protein [Verrucomicrobiaceae bacterium]